MQFDFDTFCTIAEPRCRRGVYSWEETREVFRYYFEKYEAECKKPHPPIRAEQIEKCMNLMPWFSESARGSAEYIRPADYPAMIDRYFGTAFNNGRCDRNINHFFSGSIREYRYRETHAVDEYAQRARNRMDKYLRKI